ncbi:MAG: zinc-ribbon domain-containing transport protein [bacterium]|nr:zinc-ribbon domain-containing transport protein [bacterium]
MSFIAIVIIVLVLVAVGGISYGLMRLKSFTSDAAFVVSALKDGLEDQAAELEHTPKSVNGMTSLCLPRITKDFPAFNWYEFRQKAENMLKSALRAISNGDISLLIDASADLRNQVGLEIAANRDNGIREVYQNIDVHQTEIATYRKQGGTCVIALQTSIGYIHYVEDHGEVTQGSKTVMEQTRYNIELQYIQDTSQIAEGETALGTTCPNCGAPITSVGQKTCEYCGLAVTEININTWALNRYSEI